MSWDRIEPECLWNREARREWGSRIYDESLWFQKDLGFYSELGFCLVSFFFLIIYLLMAAPDLGCCAGLSLSWQSGATFPCGAWVSHCSGFPCCFGSCSRPAQWLWCLGLVAVPHAGSSWTSEQTPVPCIGRQILNLWTSRKRLLNWVLSRL